METEMYAMFFSLGLYQHALNVLEGLGWKASGRRAAKRLCDNAWKAHLKTGRTYVDTLVTGVDEARSRIGNRNCLLN